MDDSFKLKTNNNVSDKSDKSTYANFISNNNYTKANQFKNISLNLNGSEEMYIKENNNNKKNTKMKRNILQNNSNINININTNEMKKI